MTYFELMKTVRDVCKFIGTEKPGLVTNSELRRWFEGSIIINGTKVLAYDEVIYPITSVILFPKGKRRCTLV